ncbi:glycosyltransferase family 2 protein [bacterium]|nr:glycosyltransferase family 2 protein [bacterium]
MKVGVVIPAFNVGKRIEDVLLKVRRYIPNRCICVVDDGSTERNGNMIQKQHIHLIRHQKNNGKGEALKSGFRWILSDGFDGVLTLDGDGQHDGDAIPDFISTMERTSADIVLGIRRFKLREMPFDRICSNRLTSLFVSAMTKQWIPDSQTGYRLIKSDVLKHIALNTSHYETETELLIKAIRKGFSVSFCPIVVNYDNPISHIDRMKDTERFCKLIIQLIKEK